MRKIKNIKTFFNKKNLKYNNFKYFLDYFKFKKLGGEITYFHPMLNDSLEQAGISKGHYFHQDLLVASYIYKSNPETHIDIGSRIDGFVAHVASFRKIQIIDIRNLNEIAHENISFIKLDLTKTDNSYLLSDSVSCLHAIEHFGLGRYGDTIDPIGHIKGFNNILKLIKKMVPCILVFLYQKITKYILTLKESLILMIFLIGHRKKIKFFYKNLIM